MSGNSRARGAWAVIAAAILGTAAQAAPGDWQIVSIPVASREEVQALADAGLDIWEARGSAVLARVSGEERLALAARGADWRVVWASDAAYFAAIGAPQDGRGAPDAGAFTTYEEMVAQIDVWVATYPELCQKFSIGTSFEGRQIWAMKISDSVATDEDEPEFMITGCHHAREWISIEVPMYHARQLLEGTDPDAVRLRNGMEWWIVPMINPDGHNYTITNERLWRKNRRPNGDGSFGTDLNRNYSYQWGGPGSSSFTTSDVYRGPSAFSEVETQRVRDFAQTRTLAGEICYHSYSQLVLTPWGYTEAPSPDEAWFVEMSTRLADKIEETTGAIYTPQAASDLYLASGGSLDWFYGAEGVRAMTFELRPASAIDGGFVLPESQIDPTVRENWAALKVWALDLVVAPQEESWSIY